MIMAYVEPGPDDNDTNGHDDLNDTDNDGLPDKWEKDHFGSLSQGPADDYDNDNVSNLDEYLAGTDPTDPNDPSSPDDEDGDDDKDEDSESISGILIGLILVIIIIIIVILLALYLQLKKKQAAEPPLDDAYVHPPSAEPAPFDHPQAPMAMPVDSSQTEEPETQKQDEDTHEE
jgi:hypothetical protein